MANKVVTTTICDLPHRGEMEATQTVAFAFDGTPYEIDVCQSDNERLQAVFGKYVEHARNTNGGRRRKPQQQSQRRSAPVLTPTFKEPAASNGSGQPAPSDVRAWAKDQNIKVPTRGRIPGPVLDQYKAAH